MKITNIKLTKSGYSVIDIISNLDGTILIGKIENIEDPGKFINTKWDINRDLKIAVSRIDTKFDLCIDGIYIPINIESPIKNFYTFNKNAWHCKLYKWIFGKEPHKVHPTMCPYFWIMVVVFLTFPLILLYKLTGSIGSNTRKYFYDLIKKQKEAKNKAYIDHIVNTYHSLTPKESFLLYNEKKFKYCNIPSEIYWIIKNKSRDYENSESSRKMDIIRKKDEIQYKKEEKNRELIKIKQVKSEKDLVKRKELGEKITKIQSSKTSKILGICLVVVISVVFIYYIALGVSTFSSWFFTKTVYVAKQVKWTLLGITILKILGFLLSGMLLFFIIKSFFVYMVLPTYRLIVSKSIRPSYNYVTDKFKKIPKFNIIKKIKKVFKFLFAWLPILVRIICDTIAYTVDFFAMIKDLIYSMYKKNCPVITWTDKEE